MESRVHQTKRLAERDELVSACRSLLHECDQMLYLIMGHASLGDIKEKLTQVCWQVG